MGTRTSHSRSLVGHGQCTRLLKNKYISVISWQKNTCFLKHIYQTFRIKKSRIVLAMDRPPTNSILTSSLFELCHILLFVTSRHLRQIESNNRNFCVYCFSIFINLSESCLRFVLYCLNIGVNILRWHHYSSSGNQKPYKIGAPRELSIRDLLDMDFWMVIFPFMDPCAKWHADTFLDFMFGSFSEGH